jgi:hypothetical protein
LCGDEVSIEVEANWLYLQFGNVIARTNPERTSQFTDQAIARFARYSEQKLFNAMIANSTNVTTVQELGAVRDYLTQMNRAAINYRARHRMAINAPLRTVVPLWVIGLLQDDQTKALQSYPEQFELAVADIERWLRQRNVTVTWFQDDFTDNQNAGVLNTYPATFQSLLYHEGAHVYVDNGVLDLGLVRDSTLIASNNFQTFTEEFWNTGMWGVESLALNWSLCANGASAGSLDPVCGS